MSRHLGASRDHPDATWRDTNTYLYARRNAGEREKRLTRRVAWSGCADYSRQHLSFDAPSWFTTDRLIWRPTPIHALGWAYPDRQRRLSGMEPGAPAQAE